MTPDSSSAHCAGLVKEASPARYVAALFAPAVPRRFLFALYAFDAELQNIHRAAREPMIVAMRFQWWRDALERLPGEARGHPVLMELARAIEFGALEPAPLVEIVEARESRIEPVIAEIAIVRLAARVCGARQGPNALAEAVGVAIGSQSPEFLAEARRLWRGERRTRRSELPAYLPATFVDARHPVTAFRLHWLALRRGLGNRF